MANPDTSTALHSKDAKPSVKRLDERPRLTDDDIRVAISCREEDLDNTKYCANFGVVILLIVIVSPLLRFF
jgi:hypothetical protein